jgi:putative ABC transport system permease protein
VAGVSFAVLLVFSQLGFYFAVLASSTAVYRAMDSDIFLTSPAYVQLAQARTIPRQRLYQAAGIEGVRDAAPLYVDTHRWRNPETRLRLRMFVIGVHPSRNPFNISSDKSELLGAGQVLIDVLSRRQVGRKDIGLKTEIGDHQVRISGQYRIGPGLIADGSAMVSDDMFIRLFKNRKINEISIGAVRLQPGADARRVAAALKQTLPHDTEVFTRAEMLEREEVYWKERASIGPVFAAGAVLGLIVGIVVVYQVVATDIANRIREYATLKALGYDARSLRRIVLEEVLLFGVMGFAIAALMSAGLFAVVSNVTGLPATMELGRSVLVFLLTLSMCCTAGLLATRKLSHADPADLF